MSNSVFCSNDAFDATMGIDKDKAESVVNLTQNRVGVLWTANAFLVAGAALLWRVVSQTVRMQLPSYPKEISSLHHHVQKQGFP